MYVCKCCDNNIFPKKNLLVHEFIDGTCRFYVDLFIICNLLILKMYDSSFYGKRELRKLREIGPDQLNMFKICFRNVKKKKNKIN